MRHIGFLIGFLVALSVVSTGFVFYQASEIKSLKSALIEDMAKDGCNALVDKTSEKFNAWREKRKGEKDAR